mmetsp:Transcript_2781/g.2610  ORF Transcript_2781/g.2610 Transcript_2781/m.2610 type:complete len:106 (+) Transcript_2781:601-918(+)
MFFPSRKNQTRLTNILKKAKHSVDVCIFALTNDSLRDALIYLFERGVSIRIITDDVCSSFTGADIFELGELGIPCTMDDNKRVHMHNKFAIIDSLILVTGSFNWT